MLPIPIGGIRYFFMRMYNIPPNMSEKEKVIGGLLNLNQFFWVLGGLALSALTFAGTFNIVGGTLALIIAFPLIFSGLPFALYKKNDLTLFRYLTLKRKFNKKIKKLPNIKKEVSF